jgi:hypothetical protein
LKKYITFILFFSSQIVLFGQEDNLEKRKFSIQTDYNRKAVHTGDDTVTVTTLKFYISNLVFVKEEIVVYQTEGFAHLIDLEMASSTQWQITLPKNLDYDEVKFILGIDSAINVSGALSGDLDPTRGMYWTWQSGYINVKLEGAASMIKGKDKTFQYHLGGYLKPYLAAKPVQIQMNQSEDLNFTMDLGHLFGNIDFMNSPKIMSPSKGAVIFSQMLATSIVKDEKD